MIWEEACQILGVKKDASQAAIREQYRYKLQLLHPDKNQNKTEDVRKKAEEELKYVISAYDFLRNPLNSPGNLPKLDVSPRHIRFRDIGYNQTKATKILVKSVGGTFTNIWIDTDSLPQWLKVTNVKSLASGPLPLEITLKASGISTLHKHSSCELLIRLENENTKTKDEVKVKIDLLLKTKPAHLLLQEDRIDFTVTYGDAPSSETFTIMNDGEEILHCILSSSKTWISIGRTTIDVLPNDSETVIVSANNTNLSSYETNKGNINIKSNGGNALIEVIYTVNSLHDYQEATIGYPSEPVHKFSFKLGNFLLTMVGLSILPGSIIIIIIIRFISSSNPLLSAILIGLLEATILCVALALNIERKVVSGASARQKSYVSPRTYTQDTSEPPSGKSVNRQGK